MKLIFGLVWQSGIAPGEKFRPDDFPFTHTAAEYDDRLAAMHLAVTSLRQFDATQCTDRTNGPYCNFFDKGKIVVNKTRKSPEQFGPIFWDIFFRVRKTMGDFEEITAQQVKTADDIGEFAKFTLKIPVGFAENGQYEFKFRSVLHGNCIGFVDQLLCVAVYGSLSDMLERVPEDKLRIFDEAPDRAAAVRGEFIEGWKRHFKDAAALPGAGRKRNSDSRPKDPQYDETSSEDDADLDKKSSSH